MIAIAKCDFGPTKSATPERSAEPCSSCRTSPVIDNNPTPSPELTVVVPTLNEVGNVEALYRAVADSLNDTDWEILFVDDDSTDGTLGIVRSLAHVDRRVRCIRRIGRRGLAGAVIEGFLASSAFAVAVIDADMQHDERLLPRMLQSLRGDADLAIGSRYVAEGRAEGGLSWWRMRMSEAATQAARLLFAIEARDPMSGFFMIRRDLAERIAPSLSSQGFKILLDLLVSAEKPLRIMEHGYEFRPRNAGVSKLDRAVTSEYIGLLVAKASGDRVSARFLSFALVGLSGFVVHLLLLHSLLATMLLSFVEAQLASAIGAMTYNFALNNAFTYRDRRLKGLSLVWGLLTFYPVCSVGAVANVGVASWIYGNQPVWWLAGAAGAVMGAFFNYSATAAFTWRRA
jgi:dolichol-phosphate mannosyltransferase